jgi:hypothetical protein
MIVTELQHTHSVAGTIASSYINVLLSEFNKEQFSEANDINMAIF